MLSLPWRKHDGLVAKALDLGSMTDTRGSMIVRSWPDDLEMACCCFSCGVTWLIIKKFGNATVQLKQYLLYFNLHGILYSFHPHDVFLWHPPNNDETHILDLADIMIDNQSQLLQLTQCGGARVAGQVWRMILILTVIHLDWTLRDNWQSWRVAIEATQVSLWEATGPVQI